MAYETGDLVTLVSGSMRMAVEAVDGENIAVVWCNEGEIGRDVFNTKLLKKWEMREEHGDRRPPRPRRDDDGDRPKRPYKPRGDDDDAPRKPRPKTGWDGKPREKKFFRKDD